jgi:hypothetical protein
VDGFSAHGLVSRYPFHEDTVIHPLGLCLCPDEIGDALAGFAKHDGDLLVLSTKPINFQPQQLHQRCPRAYVSALSNSKATTDSSPSTHAS